MIPSKSCAGFFPVIESIRSATRLCKPHFSIANEIINPPINKNRIGSMYCAAVSFISMMPSDGNNTKGRREVIAICTTSVNHQSATQHTSPSMAIISGWLLSNAGRLLIITNNSGPARRSKLRFKMGWIGIDKNNHFNLKIWWFENLMIWKFDDLMIWWFENLMIWKYANMLIC